MFFSAKRLIHRHRETRIYVTEITYSRSGEPKTIYMFIPEENTEIEADVYLVLYKKKLRSRGQMLYHLSLNKDFTLLLLVDLVRGNHYVYCRLPVLKQLFNLNHLPEELIGYRLESAAGRDSTDNKPSASEKITFIDTEVLCTHPNLILKMIQESTVILSPYYVMELDAYTTSYAEKLTVIDRIEKLSRQFPNSLLVNKNSGNGYLRDSLSATNQAHENLLEAALEHPIDKSQMTIVTNDSLFAVRAEMQGLSVHIPQASKRVAPEFGLVPFDSRVINKPITDSAVQEIMKAQTQEFDLYKFPPRSQRHRNSRGGLFASVKSYFYSILL